MKKFITLVITCSLALAAGAIAQDETSPAPTKKQQRQKMRQERREARQERQGNPAGAAATPHARGAHAGMNANANADVNANANTQAEQQAQRNANRKAARAERHANAAKANAQTQVAPQADKAQANNTRANGKPKKPADVEKIKTQHASFHAEARPNKVPAVTFSESHRINGAEHWQGPKYTVFRSYHPQRHDQGWYHSHYSRIELIGGGYYYFNAGYWYPAWGYQPTAQYYVYDGPIYAGRAAEPPDRVIADVQASLQEMGYYKGEVDGLLGPLTREALTAYQSDNGLYTTAAIDEPTLNSLGLG